MPMSRDERIEKVQRLLTAHGRTKKVLENEPVVLEGHQGVAIAECWPVITAAYSGLEQTIKYLIAEEKGLTVQDLFDIAVAENGEGNEGRWRNHPYRTHNLGWLFSQLDNPTKEIVREFFRRYKSLLPSIRIEGVDEFLSRVSGRKGEGDGYVRWRYALIEEKKLPTNSPEALVAIWGACVEIAQDRAWENGPVQMPDDELGRKFCARLKGQAEVLYDERQEPMGPFETIKGEIIRWLQRRSHPLDAFAEVLWHFARYDHSGVDDAPEWLSETLTRWARDMVKEAAESGPTLLRAFVLRAQGHTAHGESVRWNQGDKRFESVRWSLEERFQERPPANATLVDDPTVGCAAPLCSLWIAAKESGYRVRENRRFQRPQGRDPWFCTLEVTDENAGSAQSVLSMWQKKLDAYCGRFHMVEECEPDAMSQPVRRWIDSLESKRREPNHDRKADQET